MKLSKKILSALLTAVMVQSVLTTAVVMNVSATELNGTVISQVAAISLDKTTLSLKVGDIYTLTARNNTGTTLTWKSSNANVATVNSKGRVVARGEGTANITVVTADKQKAVCTVTVRQTTTVTLNKTSLSLFVKETANLTATVTNNESPVTVTFKSNNANVATVNSQGRVVARGIGTANITAVTSDGHKAVCTVTVKEKPTISLNKTSLTLREKDIYTLTATVTPQDSDATVTFKSSNANVVTVNSKGRVVARGQGTATVKAIVTGGATASCEVTVKQSYADEVIELVNIERANEGLPPLEKREDVCALADIRAEELTEEFSHTRPDGRSCSTVFTDANVRWSALGENIAAGYRTPQAVMNGWMNSEGHRANILSSNFTGIGVSMYEQNGVKYWVQLFIK